jgi:hypothetical protein
MTFEEIKPGMIICGSKYCMIVLDKNEEKFKHFLYGLEVTMTVPQ